ncbi:MAG: putative glycosyltransferase, partial [Bacteroidota bacterium]
KSSEIELIGNGIEDPLQKAFEQPNTAFVQQIEQFLDSSKQVFLFLSRKSAKKGIDLLLAAFAEMSKNPDWNGQLILAGPADDYSKEITFFIAQNPSLQILELPLVSGAEKDYLYKKSTYVVLPSYSEGFSFAALEALAYGKCCILSNRIGFSQLVEKEQAALVFEPTYPKLLQQFTKVSAENFDANGLRKSARKLYLDNFQSLDISNKLYHFIFVKNM